MTDLLNEILGKIDAGEKWAIIGVPGVQSKGAGIYVLNDIEGSGYEISKFAARYELNTESFFDKGVPGWFLKIPLMDKAVDIFRLIKQKSSRIAICRKLRSDIQHYQDAGFKIFLVAHSWGTIISIICGPNNLDADKKPIKIDAFLMMGCPLGLSVWLSAVRVAWFVLEFLDNFTVQKIEYHWSRKDPISMFLWDHVERILRKIGVEIFISRRHSGHGVLDYLKKLDPSESEDKHIFSYG